MPFSSGKVAHVDSRAAAVFQLKSDISKMEFSPANPIVRHCLQGIALEENGQPAEAASAFEQAWNEASHDFEKFMAAFFFSRHQASAEAQLQWLNTALDLALRLNDDAVRAALPVLYSGIASCHEQLQQPEQAKRSQELAAQAVKAPIDQGPFFHGTKAALPVGDFLVAGFGSNYQSGLTMNHIYFTALPNGAGLAASLAKGDGPERVYIVAPTGPFEDDPNVTNKKFPGNPTRSYRTGAPLKIVGELIDWARQTPAERQEWLDKLAKSAGEIIN